jgi:hypothetical protein
MNPVTRPQDVAEQATEALRTLNHLALYGNGYQ